MTEEVTEAQADAEAQELTVEVDGVHHRFSQLSDQAKELVRMHQRWNGELSEQTDRSNQLRMAIQQVASQLIDVIRKDVKEEGEVSDDPAA